MNIQEMQNQIDGLKREIDALKSSSGFPFAVENAIRERLGAGVLGTGTGSPTAANVYGSFPVTAPVQPSGTLKVTYLGVTYELLYK